MYGYIIIFVLAVVIISYTLKNYQNMLSYIVNIIELFKPFIAEEFTSNTSSTSSTSHMIKPYDPNSYLIDNKYGPTYYKDPKLMTEKQKHKFANIDHFSNMTIGDYINYLLVKTELKLPINLSENNVLLRHNQNERLILSDIPNDPSIVPPPPLNAQEYYEAYGDMKL